MFSANDKISLRQLQILLILILFSTNSLTLPHDTANILKQNGWMLIISSGVLLTLFIYTMISLAKLFPKQSLVVYGPKIISWPIGHLISLSYLSAFIVMAALELRLFGELVKEILLKTTPIELIMLMMLLVVVYLNRKGIECRARMAELIIFIALMPVVLIMLFAITEVEFSNLCPIIDVKISEFIKGSYQIAMLYIGTSSLLFAYPMLNNKKGVFKGLTQSVIFVTIITVVINTVTIGIFSHEGTSSQLWPVMTIMQVIELPGAFIERQDALMMSFWILTVFTLINAFVYYGSLICSQLFKTKENRYFNVILVPIIYIVSLMPDNVIKTHDIYTWLNYRVSIVLLFIFPLVLLLIAKVRKMGVNDA